MVGGLDVVLYAGAASDGTSTAAALATVGGVGSASSDGSASVEAIAGTGITLTASIAGDATVGASALTTAAMWGAAAGDATTAASATRSTTAAAATGGDSTMVTAGGRTTTATAAAAGDSSAAASPTQAALSFLAIGDSYTWYLQGGGSTYARVDAAYPINFLGSVSNKTIVSMADVPAGVADPLSVSDQGYPVYGSGDGCKGFTQRGLFFDELVSRGVDPEQVAFYGFGKGGTSVQDTGTTTFGKWWTYGIPPGSTTGLTAANAVAADSQWARTDITRPGDPTTCAQRIASTPNLTVLLSMGGNDVIQHGGEYNWVDRTTGVLDGRWATRADSTRAGLVDIASFLRRLNPTAHVVHVSYPNIGLDDSRRVVPTIRRPAHDWAEYPNRWQYESGLYNYPGVDYSAPYKLPWDLESVEFDPAWFAPGNPGAGTIQSHPGFWRTLFMGTNLTRDWDYEIKDWVLRWYSHAYADWRYDNNWFNFFGWNTVSWSDEFGAALSNQLFNFRPWTIQQFFTAMTADVTSKRWAETVWRDMLGPRFAAVETAARSAGSNWTYLPMWDAIDGGGGPSDAKAPAQSGFFDTLHMNRTTGEEWVGEIIDAWLPTSPYRALLGI